MTDKSGNVHTPCRTSCSRASGKSDSLLLLLHSQHQTLTQRTKHVSQSRSAPTSHAEGYCQCQSWYIVGLEQLIDGESALQDSLLSCTAGPLTGAGTQHMDSHGPRRAEGKPCLSSLRNRLEWGFKVKYGCPLECWVTRIEHRAA